MSAVTGRDIDLDYCDTECFALEMNKDHSVIFEIASKYCILDSLVDFDGYSVRISKMVIFPALWTRWTWVRQIDSWENSNSAFTNFNH